MRVTLTGADHGMEFVIAILLVLVLVQAIAFALRTSKLQRELAELRGEVRNSSFLLQTLTRRVFDLERGAPAEATPVVLPPPPVEAAPEPGIQEAVTPVQEPPRERADLETLIGGNLLNKLGALILVIGIALFLGYSLTQLGPGGKVAIGIVVGIFLLAAGLAAERRESYVTFGRGLIGGGWAAIYFTTYSAHAVPAARLIESPAVGMVLLLCVALLMIAHSFVYRSQPVTALAYLIAFVTLNISPLTEFTLVATVVLAASMIVLAARYEWTMLALGGVILTYVTFLVGYDAAIYSHPGLGNGQIVLWIYWITFEAYDLIALRRAHRETRVLLPLNAIGFVTASVFHQSQMGSQQLATLLTLTAGAYLVSTAIRARLQPASTADPVERFISGSWEPALFVAAAAAAGACIERFEGLTLAVALLVEVELLVVAGLLVKDRYLTALGAWFSVLPFMHLLAVDINSRSTVEIAGRSLYRWTPLAIVMAACFAANRALTRAGFLYTTAAGICLSVVFHYELAPPWATVAWAAMAIVTLAAAVYWNHKETRWQAYVLSAATLLRAIDINLSHQYAPDRLATLALIVAILYAAMLLLHAMRMDGYARTGYCIAATALLTALVVVEAPAKQVSLQLGMEGIVLLAAGFLLRERVLRLSGLAVFLCCIAKLFLYDLRELDTLSRILSFIVLGILLLAASWAYTRYRDQMKKLL